MTHDVIVVLSVLGVIGQVLAAGMLMIGLLALVGVRGPLNALRSGVEGYELWLAFVVASIATGGSRVVVPTRRQCSRASSKSSFAQCEPGHREHWLVEPDVHPAGRRERARHARTAVAR